MDPTEPVRKDGFSKMDRFNPIVQDFSDGDYGQHLMVVNSTEFAEALPWTKWAKAGRDESVGKDTICIM